VEVGDVKPPARTGIKAIVVGSAVLVAGIAAAPAAFAAAGPLTNGGFETYQLPAGTPYQTVAMGGEAGTIAPWKVSMPVGGSVDLVGSYWQAAEGTQSIDLSGNSSANISQDIAVIPGHTYRVDFAYSGNPDGGPQVKQLGVSMGSMAGPNVNANLTVDVVALGITHTDMKWQHSFVEGLIPAGMTDTHITFRNLATPSTAYGPVIDAVTITDETAGTALPEAPAAAFLAGAGLLAVAGVGIYRRRRA
jgi:choice-of-anchor C domain-containing protein